ncbi:MAG TPA: hypothetical protein VLC09_03395 [Polyangiaceae bacterium]|nr:hypothetical protein [Polyangiaceae bacterium]
MSGYQVGPETFVTVSTEVFDAEGESVGEAEVMAFVFGRGLLFPRVEQSLEGRTSGDVVEVSLAPRDAFGQRDPGGILEVSREEFPPDVEPGDRYEVENDEGGLLIVHVLDVGPETVHIDTNHPLAGQTVKLRIQVLEVRVATEEELAAAEGELAEAAEAQEKAALGRPDGAEAAERPDVSVSSLIRSRR